MKGGVKGHVIANAVNATKMPKHIRTKGDGKPGQTFDTDRFVALCIERNKDPAYCALKVLERAEKADSMTDKELFDAYRGLMEFAYPKRRALDSKVDVNGNLTIEIVADFGD